MLDGRRWTGDYDVIRRDGTTFSVFVTNTPVFGRDGRLVAVIGSSVDVTERKMGEEARRQLAAIVESSGDAIFSTTVDGLVTSWNGAAERLFGYRADEMLGQPVADRWRPLGPSTSRSGCGSDCARAAPTNGWRRFGDDATER